MTTELTRTSFDVAVIGGGAAGLSAGIVLGRARRSVAVLDAGKQRNAPADGIHGFVTRDGMPPHEFVAAGRAEVAGYGGTVLDAEATAVRREGTGFAVTTADGRELTARRLLVTTGLVDELPDVPGLRARWGRDVIHCPYCHGYEVRDEPIGILAGGPMAIHQALLFRQLSDDVLLFQHTAPEFAADDAEQLAARGIRVVPGRVTGLEVDDDRLSGVRMDGGEVVPRRVVVVGPRMIARSQLLEMLGLVPIPHPLGESVGMHIAADPTGRTDVPGVWVAGNVADVQAQVVTSAAQGVQAATAINADLVAEDTRQAVARYRESAA